VDDDEGQRMTAAVADARAFDVPLPDGRVLHAFESGVPDGVPVLVHHGTPSSGQQARTWVEDATPKGIRLLSYDRAGYGGSTRREGRRVVDVADDIAALLDHLGIDRFLTWGVSGGGPHVLACAAMLPDRVIAAVSVAAAAPYDADGLDFLAGMGQDNLDEFGAALAGEHELRPMLEKLTIEMQESTPDGLREVLDSLLPSVDKAALTGERAQFLHASTTYGLSNGVDGWIDDDLAFVTPWGFDVRSISVPFRLMQGEQDLMVPFAHGTWLAERIPGVEAVLPPAEGHLSLSGRFGEVHDWLLAQA
jgi:pimeloyl-ACP methyl ester carboxylesterase